MTKKSIEIKQKEAELIKTANDEADQVKKFLLILVGVSLVAVALYFISKNYIVKDAELNNDNSTGEVTITYNNVNVGNVFNRPYDEYYVFAYDPNSLKASYYSALLNNFDTEKGKIYFLDLSIGVNKEYIGETSNKDAKKANELSLKEPTLIQIKDGKIAKYYDTIEDIEKEIG